MSHIYQSTGAPSEPEDTSTGKEHPTLKNVQFRKEGYRFSTHEVDVDVVPKEEEKKFYEKVRETSLL